MLMLRLLQPCKLQGRPEISVLATRSLRLAARAMQLTLSTPSPTQPSCAGCLARKVLQAFQGLLARKALEGFLAPVQQAQLAHLAQKAVQGLLAALAHLHLFRMPE